MSTTHTLTFEVPTMWDYLNGGSGDLVAQCACGAYEFVSSRQEGRYWHMLHRTNPGARAARLLQLLVDNPMPEGWEEAPAPVTPLPTRQAPAARVYTCPRCLGRRTVEASYSTIGGRFYHMGERATCPDCSGTGVTDKWVWPGVA